MAKEPKKLATWAISRIKGTPAVEIGRVEAADAESAIKEAIRQFNITDSDNKSGLRHGGSSDAGARGINTSKDTDDHEWHSPQGSCHRKAIWPSRAATFRLCCGPRMVKSPTRAMRTLGRDRGMLTRSMMVVAALMTSACVTRVSREASVT
jgi:hypothetical protein